MYESCKLSLPCTGFVSGILDTLGESLPADTACSLQIHWAGKLFCSSWALVLQLVSLRRGKGNTFTIAMVAKSGIPKANQLPLCVIGSAVME